MKIYTKSGDSGKTQVYADEVIRLHKNDDILECYGSLDELNANIGLLISYSKCSVITQQMELLTEIQKHLFQIGFAISASTSLTADDVIQLEQAIDSLQADLPPQTHFILPGGHTIAAQAQVCRTVARRAERRMVALLQHHQVPDVCLHYLNRLSDYLFVIARAVNQHYLIEDVKV
ncbi:cob(I)yrinic acid a,c-diamide adenosyltransferase [Aliiglaciecola lipolytica]|uniref:Corrinoid adenosyltransferase n=1 Tax=Aliiglaciecola lipolytica E3 TaxID=1127673 RepID=K6X0G8_9ALTE|nr:cob(I)yrinic acid a,c-diamide adenosyltransferase [Aliiglaciecola lipolytica]GAC14174.1 cob(I)yrinic acid a,c-diamide adenosyltransferase, mitochondrial [Aliiglaciecola lipolytica E3]